MPELHNLRQVYVETLLGHAAKDKRIVSLDADSREATMADRFAKVYPERSFSFGIAEENMVSAAGGMATMGLIPFVNSYAMFVAMRSLDQLRNSIAYPNLNVKFVLSHHGLDAGADGVTHQLTEDIAILRAIPNLKLLQPADPIEMAQMVDFAVRTDGPVVIKSGKSPVPAVHPADYRWRYGIPSCIACGDRCAIVANGVMVERALRAREELQTHDGLSATVINLSSLTDVDADALLGLVGDAEVVVTVEDHSIFGGVGGIVSELLSERRPRPVRRIGLRGTFAECGTPDELFRKYRMDESFIVKTVREYFRR